MSKYERADWLLKELPAYPGDNELSKKVYNCGNYIKTWENKDACDGLMQSVLNTSINEFTEYMDVLKGNGYQEECKSSVENNVFYRFTSNKKRVCANYYENEQRALIIFEEEKGISPEEISYTYIPQTGELAEVYLFGLKMDPRGMNRKVPENTSGFINNGQSMIIKCADNSVIMIDGGDERQMMPEDRERFWRLLHKITNTKEEETIRISAWFISHIHNDHVSGLCEAVSKEPNKCKIERVICNAPNPMFVENAQERTYQMSSELLRNYFPNSKEIKVHTGDVIQIADIALTVVYTHEDLVDENGIFPCGDFNATSTVIVAEAASELRVLITGDINEMAEEKMVSHFTGETLNCHVLQQPHHNFNDNRLVYEYGDAQVMLFTQTSGGLVKNEMMISHSERAKQWCDEWYCGGDETVGFTYKDGKIQKIYHMKDIY